MDEQYHRLDQFALALQTLLTRTAHLDQSVPQVMAAPVSAAAPSSTRSMSGSAPLPQRYGGNPIQCRGFLNQVGIYFEMLPLAFPSDRAKVGFLISLLSDTALAWANPLWETNKPVISNYLEFVASFSKGI